MCTRDHARNILTIADQVPARNKVPRRARVHALLRRTRDVPVRRLDEPRRPADDLDQRVRVARLADNADVPLGRELRAVELDYPVGVRVQLHDALPDAVDAGAGS